MNEDEFMAAFGGLYEHSPWVAGSVFAAGLDERHDVPGPLHRAFRQAVLLADRDAQAELLRAHPELACGRRDLTQASLAEQAGAGLDQCTDEEFEEFRQLNQRYQERFGFPFIVAVRGRGRGEILENFRERVRCEPQAEFREALEQVCLIGRYRLEKYFDA